MRQKITVTYRDFLLFASLIILLCILFAAAVKCVFIFPPYLQSYKFATADITGTLDFFVIPAIVAGVCAAFITFVNERSAESAAPHRRFYRKIAVLLAACGLTIPCGALAMRLDDVFYARNYVPPAVFFAAFAAAALTARGLIGYTPKTKKRRITALVCSAPLAVIAVVSAVAGFSGHKLFATLAFLYLPIPFCAAAALAASVLRSPRIAAAAMCCPLSVCIFCALRPYGFDFAFGLCAALSVLFPIITVIISIHEYYKKQENTNMANKIISGLGFHHIALKSANFEKSYAFYTEGMGMVPTAAWGEGDNRIQMLDIGDGTILELFAGGSDDADAGRYLHLAFSCNDVDAAFKRAVAAGAKIKSEPRTVPLDSKPSPMTLHVAFVFGPSGEELEFFKIVK